MTIATIVQAAMLQTNQTVTVSNVVTSVERVIQEMVEQARQVGEELARRHDWGALTVDFSGTISAASAASGLVTLPTDFLRFTQGSTVVLGGVPLRGALSEAEMALKRRAAFTSPRRWQLRGTALEIAPRPIEGQTLTFSYVSTNWIKTIGGAQRNTWQADTDAALISENLILLGVLFRHRRQIVGGAAAQDAMDEFEAEFERSAMADRGMRLPASRPPSVVAP